MTDYVDNVVTLDDSGVTIENHLLPGRPRRIAYDDIVAVDAIELGFATGRHRLVGMGPFRPRHFFHWDRKRSQKSRGVVLDLGRWLRVVITPDDPDTVLDLLRRRIA